MAGIIRMNINGDIYDLPGGGSLLVPEDGIIIDDDGHISIDPTYITSETKAIIAGLDSEAAAIIVDKSGIYQIVYNISEGLYTYINTTAGQIQAELLNTSEGLKHLIQYTTSETKDIIYRYINSEFVPLNEFIRSTSETRSNIYNYINSELAGYSTIEQTATAISAAVSGLNNDYIGVKLANGKVIIANENIDNPTTYSSFDGSGMQIIQNGIKVAEATSSKFWCNNALGVGDWYIGPGSIGSVTLDFYRE